MHCWQLQEAKAKLTQLVNEAKIEPQVITRRGVPETVVLSIEQYEALIGQSQSMASFLRHSPLVGIDWECERDRSLPRDMDLF